MKIAVFEDDRGFTEALMSLLEWYGGHTVVLTCVSVSEAQEALRCTDDGKLLSGVEFEIAIVDGNLSFGRYDGGDGEEVCRLLKQLSPVPHIIGNSGGGSVRGADTQANKDVTRLLELLA